MSQLSALDPRRLLSLPAVYRAFQGLVGGESAWRPYIENVIRVQAGERMLDIGCGPGHIVQWLSGVEYHGFDLDEDYIKEARARFGDRAKFYHRAVTADVATDLGQFDVAAATGVLHHIDDATAENLFRAARAVLKPGGRLVTCDGALVKGANPLATLLVSMDRGEYVRAPEQYLALARRVFERVDMGVRTDLSRVPYVHCVMTCWA